MRRFTKSIIDLHVVTKMWSTPCRVRYVVCNTTIKLTISSDTDGIIIRITIRKGVKIILLTAGNSGFVNDTEVRYKRLFVDCLYCNVTELLWSGNCKIKLYIRERLFVEMMHQRKANAKTLCKIWSVCVFMCVCVCVCGSVYMYVYNNFLGLPLVPSFCLLTLVYSLV